MLSALATLTFARPSHRMPNYKPAARLTRKDYGGELTDQEVEIYTFVARKMGFDDVVLLANARSKIGTWFPPFGYVATVHFETPFFHDAFIGAHELFRGVAWCQVKLPAPVLYDADRKEMRRRLNLLLRDKSPQPPRVRAPDKIMAKVDGGWVPSLGKAGWIGLYEGIYQTNNGGDDTVLNKQYYLVVVAGLDEETYNDLDHDLEIHSGGKGFTIGSMFGEGGTLDIYRHLAIENRNRLLWTALDAMSLLLADNREPVMHPGMFYHNPAPNADYAKTQQAIHWLRLPRIPAWYVVPKEQTRDGDPVPAEIAGFKLGEAMPTTDATVQRHPMYIESALDVFTNNLIPIADSNLPGLMAYYNGCATTLSSAGVPYTMGPTGPIKIFNLKHRMPWENASTKNAFPSEAAHEFSPDAQALVDLTWEKQSLTVCRNAGTWSYKEPMEMGAPDMSGGLHRNGERVPMRLRDRYGKPAAEAPSLLLTPMLVRVSAKDPLDMAQPAPEKDGRFAEAGVCLYTAI